MNEGDSKRRRIIGALDGHAIEWYAFRCAGCDGASGQRDRHTERGRDSPSVDDDLRRGTTRDPAERPDSALVQHASTDYTEDSRSPRRHRHRGGDDQGRERAGVEEAPERDGPCAGEQISLADGALDPSGRALHDQVVEAVSGSNGVEHG